MQESILDNRPAFDDYQEACRHLANISFDEMGDDTFFDYFPNATYFIQFYFRHVLTGAHFDPNEDELISCEIEQAQELIPYELVKRMLHRILELTPPVTIQHFAYEIDEQDVQDYGKWGIPLDRVTLPPRF